MFDQPGTDQPGTDPASEEAAIELLAFAQHSLGPGKRSPSARNHCQVCPVDFTRFRFLHSM
jgi:hypothetical protein